MKILIWILGMKKEINFDNFRSQAESALDLAGYCSDVEKLQVPESPAIPKPPLYRTRPNSRKSEAEAVFSPNEADPTCEQAAPNENVLEIVQAFKSEVNEKLDRLIAQLTNKKDEIEETQKPTRVIRSSIKHKHSTTSAPIRGSQSPGRVAFQDDLKFIE